MKAAKKRTNKATATKKRLVFDFETEQFSETFRCSTGTDRIRFAPKLRLACVYDISLKSYSYYEPKDVRALIATLMSADELISFNGKNFDIPVLQGRHRLSKKKAASLNLKHIDLCEEVKDKAGYRLSLDKLSKINLGENKHTSGREMSSLDAAGLRAACRSDVSQTYRLFLQFVEGSLIVPENTFSGRSRAKDDGPHIHSHLPDPFPYQYIDLDCDDMTDGQMSDYLAGTWGILDDEDMTVVCV